jgi:hypothetical protein
MVQENKALSIGGQRTTGSEVRNQNGRYSMSFIAFTHTHLPQSNTRQYDYTLQNAEMETLTDTYHPTMNGGCSALTLEAQRTPHTQTRQLTQPPQNQFTRRRIHIDSCEQHLKLELREMGSCFVGRDFKHEHYLILRSCWDENIYGFLTLSVTLAPPIHGLCTHKLTPKLHTMNHSPRSYVGCQHCKNFVGSCRFGQDVGR